LSGGGDGGAAGPPPSTGKQCWSWWAKNTMHPNLALSAEVVEVYFSHRG